MNNCLTHTDGKMSGTKIWFTVFSIVCIVKFFLADMIIFGFSFPAFDASGAAFLIAAFGGTYAFRRYTDRGQSYSGGEFNLKKDLSE
jgi:hypothetical protein